MDVKKLALSILKAETEENVIHLLNNEGLWKNLDYWKPFGANENNVCMILNLMVLWSTEDYIQVKESIFLTTKNIFMK